MVAPEPETSYSLQQSVRVGYASLPIEYRVNSEQAAEETTISLPEPLVNTGSTPQRPYTNLRQLRVPPHSSRQSETDTDIESDFDIGASSNVLDTFQTVYPGSSTPLPSLRPDPKGGPFMISDSTESSSRPLMVQLALSNELDAESDKQILPEPEEVVEEIADTHSEDYHVNVSFFSCEAHTCHYDQLRV
jgi:hypothetical protein